MGAKDLQGFADGIFLRDRDHPLVEKSSILQITLYLILVSLLFDLGETSNLVSTIAAPTHVHNFPCMML